MIDKVYQIHYELHESCDVYTGVETEVYISKDKADKECTRLNENPVQDIKYWVVDLDVIND